MRGNMRDLHKMCRICLGSGSREIFEPTLASNLIPRDDLSRIAEKLRFVTMLKVNQKENLPQQICDLCIVQLNVSYNFKRLALKNDFHIRQYMIENGMNITRDDDDNIETTTTALEIHQIQHNVIRTNRQYRQIQSAPEIRRNSTTSSVSGASTMMINGRENDSVPSTNNTFVHPKPMVRPIQIKVEPVDEEEGKEESPITSSPSNASEPASIVTVISTNPSEKRTTPMIVINGIINNESFAETTKKPDWYSTPAPLSVKLGRPRTNAEIADQMKTKERSHNLRVIKKRTDELLAKKNLRKAVKDKRVSPRIAMTKKLKAAKDEKKKKTFQAKKAEKKPETYEQKKRGRPRKNPGAPKMTYKKKTHDDKKKS